MSETPKTAKEQETSVAPMLSVRNGARAVEFYKAAFGAQVLFRHDDSKAGWSLGCPWGNPTFGWRTNRPSISISAPRLWVVELQEWL